MIAWYYAIHNDHSTNLIISSNADTNCWSYGAPRSIHNDNDDNINTHNSCNTNNDNYKKSKLLLVTQPASAAAG